MELNFSNNTGAESAIQARYIQALELEARFIILKELPLKDNTLREAIFAGDSHVTLLGMFSPMLENRWLYSTPHS